MVTVLSQQCIPKADIISILSCNPEGYVHIEPAIKRISIIDLGFGKEALEALAEKNYSINIFNKHFNPDLLMSLKSDCVLVTGGAVEASEYEGLKKSLAVLIGKKKIVAYGLGKALLKDAAESLKVPCDDTMKLHVSDLLETGLI